MKTTKMFINSDNDAGHVQPYGMLDVIQIISKVVPTVWLEMSRICVRLTVYFRACMCPI